MPEVKKLYDEMEPEYQLKARIVEVRNTPRGRWQTMRKATRISGQPPDRRLGAMRVANHMDAAVADPR